MTTLCFQAVIFQLPKMTIVNWELSLVTKQILDDFVGQGLLGSQQHLVWQVSNGEVPPTPVEDEIVVFTYHILRGLPHPGLGSSETFFIVLICTLKI